MAKSGTLLQLSLAVSILCAVSISSHAQSLSASSSNEVIVVPHEFHAWEQGGFGLKTLKEMGTPEFEAMLTAACAAWLIDCSEEAAVIRAGAYYSTPLIAGANIYTTAFIDKHPGEAYFAKFVTPFGYTTCQAAIDIGNGSITGESTFNGSIQRMPGPNGDGVGLYAVVPKFRPSGQWVSFRGYVEFVRSGSQHQCWPDNTVVWQCKGQNCSTYPGARR